VADTFGTYLTTILAEKGWSLREFARQSGAHQAALSLMNNGKRPVPLARVEAWADLLELTGRNRERFIDLAELSHAPERLRNLVLAVEKAAGKSLREHLKALK
jgi:transcriptional regulator with XRE-family HTH domain